MTAAFRAARRQTLALAVLTTVMSVPATAQTPGDSPRGFSVEEIDN